MNKAEVFALDIGTRTVAGLILAPTTGGFEIKQASIFPQLPGAMADGQIHHIDAVATIIQKIKLELEENLGIPLEKVAVAAAGRSLCTEIGQGIIELTPNQRLSSNQVRALELDAVRDAVHKLSADSHGGVMHSYLCAGYSVVQHYLDGEPIGSLQGHQGTQAKIEVIATFLPRIVIDSLGTALSMADLDMDSLTLEPIAAMHVVVPPTMRMLNIALVDIGAGTSDLAISAAGTIKGYGMVSYAGDAITQGLAEHFLLDFTVAERIKVELQKDAITECKDVFGNSLQLGYEEILAVMYPKVEILAKKIAEEIQRLNGSSPKGVILIGGGSRTPELATLLAKNLDLSENLVRIRDRESLEIIYGFPQFAGPEVITPIGIGCTHLDDRAMQLIHVHVNGQRLQFLHMSSSTVGEALLQAGIVPTELVGRPGPAFTVELNGRYIPIPGTLGQPALIHKNGEPCELNAPLEDGDSLTVEPGRGGAAPQLTLGEFVDELAHHYTFTLNGTSLEITPTILVNGLEQPMDYVLHDRDKITLKPLTTFQDLFEHLEIPVEQEIPFYLNQERKTVFERIELTVDGRKQPLNTPLRQGLQVEYTRKQCTLRDVCPNPGEGAPSITILVNGQEVTLSKKEPTPTANGQIVSFDYIIRPLDRIQYQPHSPRSLDSYILTDIFGNYEPDPSFIQTGGRILLNGQEAGFTTPIKHGDTIELVPYRAGTGNSRIPATYGASS